MWKAVLIHEHSKVSKQEDLVPEYLEPMGTKQQILTWLVKTFNGKNIPGTDRIVARGGKFDVYFDIGDEDPIRSITLATNGEAFYVIERLHEKYGWKTLDLQMNELVELKKDNHQKQIKNRVQENEDGKSKISLERNEPFMMRIRTLSIYILVIFALLWLDIIFRNYFEMGVRRGIYSTVLSVFILMVLYRFGRKEPFVGKGYAMVISLCVSILLISFNVYNNWSLIYNEINMTMIKALSFAFVLKTCIYYIFVLLGIKIRISKEKGEQSLEFRWR